jgi:hypothetical protein
MKRILASLILLAGWLPLHAAAVCFTVFEGDRIVYRDLATPIDLSGPISDAMRDKYPGGQLIINTENEHCTTITPITAVNIRAPAEAPAPMAPSKPAAPGPTADMGKSAGAAPPPAAGAPTPR